MLKKIFKSLADLLEDNEDMTLEAYIISHNPQSIVEVEMLEREYKRKQAQHGTFERYYS